MIESPRLSDYPVDPEASSRYSRFDQLNPQWWERVAAAVAAGSVEVSGLKIDRGRGELETRDRSRIPGRRRLRQSQQRDFENHDRRHAESGRVKKLLALSWKL